MDFQTLGFPTLKYQDIDIPADLSVWRPDKNIDGNIYVFGSVAKAKIPKDRSLICSFYIEDRGFKKVFKYAEEYTKQMGWYKAVIQPDFSVYYDQPLIDQHWRTFMGKQIAKLWQDNGVQVIPNLVLGSKENFECAIYGIPKGVTIAVQIQASDQSTDQDRVDEWTIKNACNILQPKHILVYGLPYRTKKLNLEGLPNLIRIKSFLELILKKQ
jgi:hypothetical protein